MRNLLDETLQALAANGYTPEDVAWVGSADGSYTMLWEQFTAVANQSYNPRAMSAQVVCDLVIVGINWWLERVKVGGEEIWACRQKPMACIPAETLMEIFVPEEDLGSDLTARDMNSFEENDVWPCADYDTALSTHLWGGH